MEELTITVQRGTTPVLITGDPIVVSAVLGALDEVLRGRDRRALRLMTDETQGGRP